MAPSWSSRLLPGSSNRPSSSSSSSNNNNTSKIRSQDKALPALPSDQYTTSGLVKPPTAGATSLHSHTRSASQPIPRLFSRKKSAANLNATYDLDDVIVPAVDSSPTDGMLQELGRKNSDNTDVRIQRRCICCDSRVKVPKELEKFRCMCCLTINDLKTEVRKGEAQEKDTVLPTELPPLTIESTQAVIERCLMIYLESRSQKREDRVKDKPEEQTPSRSLLETTTPTTDQSQASRRYDDAQRTEHASPVQSIRSPSTRQSTARKPVSQTIRQPERPGTSRGLHTTVDIPKSPSLTVAEMNERRRYDRIKLIFRPLEDYIVATFGNLTILNNSFSTVRPTPGRARSESHIKTPPPELVTPASFVQNVSLDELDAKTLLLGDIGENGSWWTGKFSRPGEPIRRKKVVSENRKPVTSKSPNIHWTQLAAWYDVIHSAGSDWQRHLDSIERSSLHPVCKGAEDAQAIEEDLRDARDHAVRTLLKVTENVLKRPGITLKQPEELRFLLIILANPSLFPASTAWPRTYNTAAKRPVTPVSSVSPRKSNEGMNHSGIVKRVLGLLANTPDVCHRYVVGWLSRLDEEHFTSLVDLCSTFMTHRLRRRVTRSPDQNFTDGGLIPDLSGGAMSTSAQLHSAMGLSGSMKKRGDDTMNETDWANDWQVRTAAKVISLLFAANNIWQGRRKEDHIPRVDSGTSSIRPQDRTRRSGQLLPTSSFYNTLLDYHDLIADFKVWESKKDRFAFCQYPLFLSMGAKIKIMEYDARRQMEIKAREAIFDQVMRSRAIDGHFHMKVRRDCMVEDSLRQISEAVGSGQEELKKSLRIHFAGEEGVDAGGLRKEWFLMLVREVFDADHGLFVYDEQSRACYFNPHTFETSDQFYLVGALLGLAIYNSTILDIALPSFAFKKLMTAANKGQTTYTLTDLAEYKPALASGLQQLLDFEGDVSSTYCWSFVAPVERFGIVSEVPLLPGGEKMAVTNANRGEFVDAYVRYILDTAVARQFEPFKRGFFTVCAGNALNLFRAEEIELLVKGSDEALDVSSLKGVAAYENWREQSGLILNPAEDVDVVKWFWQAFEAAAPDMQRKLLTFVTSSDRIPAVGATSLVLRIVAGGDGWTGKDAHGRPESQRFPIARTCFNMLVLWRYESRAQLEERLWRAVQDSEGFGLK